MGMDPQHSTTAIWNSLYRLNYIADLVSRTTDRRERAKIARGGGYTIKFIELTVLVNNY